MNRADPGAAQVGVNAVPAAAYARYSTDLQDARSIEDQHRRCREYAARNGMGVVREYRDDAVSGSHTNRPGLQQLLRDAQRRPRPPFQAVLVDDVTRLSRNVGDTYNIVFRDLALARIVLIDVTTGLRSDQPMAPTMFGFNALAAGQNLEWNRTQVRRGMEGRAKEGFWVGGRVYGYGTIPEEKPRDPEHPRKIPVVKPDEAAIVRRVFKLAAEGRGLTKIAVMLNDEGVPSPRASTRWSRGRAGWAGSTIRAMLRNERHIGRWIWNRSQWTRIAGRRLLSARPASEWVEVDRPDLAIVPMDLWVRVQGRIASERNRHAAIGRPPGTGRVASLLTGLLACGVCGSNMPAVKSKRGADGQRWVEFGCSAHRSKGSAICSNGRLVSERKVTDAVVGHLREILVESDRVERFITRFNELAERAARAPEPTEGGVRVLEKRIADAEAGVQRLAEAISLPDGGEVALLAAKLRDKQGELRRLQMQRVSLRSLRERAAVLISPARVREYLTDLFSTLAADVERGREILARHLGKVTMTPVAATVGGGYVARGAFDLAALVDKSGSGGGI